MKKGNSKINNKYIGETKNNLPEGFGTLFLPNRVTEYSGNWLLGEKHGSGIENDPQCTTKGTWKNGKRWNTTSSRDWCNKQYGYKDGIKGK